MMRTPLIRRRIGTLATAAGLVALAACADQGPSDPAARPEFNHTGDPPPFEDLGHWRLCKVGTDATFEVSVNGGAASTVQLTDGQCQDVATTPVGGGVIDVTVTELVDASTQVLDSIVMDSLWRQASGSRTVGGTNTFNKSINGDFFVEVTFFNSPVTPPPPPPPPPGTEGCTPGYWKQDHHFDSWTGYTPTTLFSDVFEDAFPGKTLLQVLQQGGGGLNALGRHTVAALLNAASGGVNYGATPQDVIDAFNAVFPGGDYESLKDDFAGDNERGCPLN